MSKHTLLRSRGKSKDDGSAILEFALLSPLLVFLMTGTFDFGRALYEQYLLTAAANAGAQYAVYQLSPNGSEGWSALSASSGSGTIASIVQNDANNTSLAVTPTYCQCPDTTGVCNTAASGSNVCTVGQGGSGASTTQAGGYNAIYVVVQATEHYYPLIPYPFITETSGYISLTGQAVVQVN
jgi:Flp pilus assembly protein TadG